MSGTGAQQSTRSKLPSNQTDQNKSTEAPVPLGDNTPTSSSCASGTGEGQAAQPPNPGPSEGSHTSLQTPTGPHLIPRSDQTSSSTETSQGTLLSAQTRSSTHNTGTIPADVKGTNQSVDASVLESSISSKAPKPSNGGESHAVHTSTTSQSFQTPRNSGQALRAGSHVQQQLQGTLKAISLTLDTTASSMSHNTESATQRPPRGTQESAGSAERSSYRSSPSVDSPADTSTLRRDKAKRRRLPWMTPDRQGQSETFRTIKTETSQQQREGTLLNFGHTAAPATRFAHRPDTPASNQSEEDPVAQQQRAQLQRGITDCEKALQKHTACYDRLDGSLDKTADELRQQRDELSALNLSVQRWEEELKQKKQELSDLGKQHSDLVQRQKEELKGKEKELQDLKKQQTEQAQQVQQLKKELERKQQEVCDLKKQQTDQTQKFQLQEKDFERKQQGAVKLQNEQVQEIQLQKQALEKKEQELRDVAKHHHEQVQQIQRQIGESERKQQELRSQLRQKSEQAHMQKEEYERKIREGKNKVAQTIEEGRAQREELRRRRQEVQDLTRQRNEQALQQLEQKQELELKLQKLQKLHDLTKQQNDLAQQQKEELERKVRDLMKQRDDQAHVHDKQLDQRQKELENREKELEQKQQTLRDLERQQNENFQRQLQELDQRQQRLNDLTAEQRALAQLRRDELDEKQQRLRDQAQMHRQELDRKKEEVDKKKQEVLDLIKRQHEEAQLQQVELEQKKQELDNLIKQSRNAAAATATSGKDDGGRSQDAATGDSSGIGGPPRLAGLDQALLVQQMQQAQHSRSTRNVFQQMEFQELSYKELSRNLRVSQAHQLPAPAQPKEKRQGTRKASFRQAKIYKLQSKRHGSGAPVTSSSNSSSANTSATTKATAAEKATTISKAKLAAQATSQPSQGGVQSKEQPPSNPSGKDTLTGSGADTIKGKKRRRESDAPSPARATAAPPSASVAPLASVPSSLAQVPPSVPAPPSVHARPSARVLHNALEVGHQGKGNAMPAQNDWSQPRPHPPPPPPRNPTS